ncbi:MAG TPA: hypothetical protein DEP42_05640 [Ruminococcaceae bacterium]|nr:hypothetical protein [Oscillospiraceae bacterium]
MFLLRFIQYLLGYTQFSAENGSIERFLSLVSKNEIVLWGIRVKDATLHASTLSRNFRKLHPFAMVTGVTLTREAQKGLPAQLKRLKRHLGVFIGIILFLILIVFFSSFVWEVDLEGNKEVPTEQIEGVLSELGLKPGAYALFMQVRYIQNGLLLRVPELAGVTINLHGSTAYVRVRERRYAPDFVPQSQPCNVKATRDGKILKVENEEGKSMIKPGEAVTAGQLLLSGVVDDRDGASRLVHARGSVVAQTSRDLRVSVPLHASVRTETGQQVRRRTLNVFNYGVPLYFGALKGDYNRYTETKPLQILQVKLPISITTKTYHACMAKQVDYTQAQALKVAKQKMAEEEKSELSGVKILSRTTENHLDNGTLVFTEHLQCEEDIATEEEIQIS